MEERGGDGGHSLAAAGESESVGGGRRDGDRSSDRARQQLLRLTATGREAWSVADQLHGDVADLEACRADPDGGLGQEGDPARSAPLRTVGAVVAAEITQSRGGQQRVAR